MKEIQKYQLAQLVNMHSIKAMFEEIKYNFLYNYSINDFQKVRDIFNDFLSLCRTNTFEHDGIVNAVNTMLAYSCIIDGYNIDNATLPASVAKVGLITCLLHDSSIADSKPAHDHIQRSISFINRYFDENKIDRQEYNLAVRMVEYTDLFNDVSGIDLKKEEERLAGCMVGTANIVGQMSTRTYLERLFASYDVIRKFKIIDQPSILQLLKKTIEFYNTTIKTRIEKDYKGVYKYCRTHFNKRYRIDANLYIEAIERQLNYLEDVLEKAPDTFKEKLRRT
ncbi:MAG: hypothetical protein JXJ19_09530 [Elusimicrobia bacterium]|nr:hypothetical protein [Elusimicrobiota bacterium]